MVMQVNQHRLTNNKLTPRQQRKRLHPKIRDQKDHDRNHRNPQIRIPNQRRQVRMNHTQHNNVRQNMPVTHSRKLFSPNPN